jgi:hypothetical protein
MATASIKNEIITHVDRLPSSLQRQVLEFTRSLDRKRLKGVQGKSLLCFAGAIPLVNLEMMARTIEEGCEREHHHCPFLGRQWSF